MVVLRGMISIQHVDKTFNENPVLQDVSFDIPDGQIFGVFGKSGVGKSTLAKVLCGICPPDAGTITLDDQIRTRIRSQVAATEISWVMISFAASGKSPFKRDSVCCLLS